MTLTGRDWLFCIPMQVGPATAYARNVGRWMYFILLIQLAVTVLRFWILVDISGGLWMLLVTLLGCYAVWHEMNITYVSCWGSLCAINGLFDILTLIIPLAVHLIKFQLLDVLIRCSIPVVYLFGALFAWHLYHDYALAHGLYLRTTMDPFGKFVEKYDAASGLPILAKSGAPAGTAAAGSSMWGSIFARGNEEKQASPAGQQVGGTLDLTQQQTYGAAAAAETSGGGFFSGWASSAQQAGQAAMVQAAQNPQVQAAAARAAAQAAQDPAVQAAAGQAGRNALASGWQQAQGPPGAQVWQHQHQSHY